MEGDERRIMAVILTHNAPAITGTVSAGHRRPDRPARGRPGGRQRQPTAGDRRIVGRGRFGRCRTGALGRQHRAGRRVLPGTRRGSSIRATAMPGCSTTTCVPTRGASSGCGPWPARNRSRRSSSRCRGRTVVPTGSGRRGVGSWCPAPSSTRSGLPMKELFWWAEDTEYLQWRIPEAGLSAPGGQRGPRRARRHPPGRRRPAVEVLLRGPQHALCQPPLKRRLGHYPRNLAKLMARAVLREEHGRVAPARGHRPRAVRRGHRPARHPLSDRADARAEHRRRRGRGLRPTSPGAVYPAARCEKLGHRVRSIWGYRAARAVTSRS